MNAASPDTNAAPASLKPRALYEVIADHLRERILGHELVAGAVLDEAELARHYGVSRTPVREAIKVLHHEGLLDCAMRKPVTVREVDAALHDEALGLMTLLLQHASRAPEAPARSGALLPVLINLVEQRIRHTRPAREQGGESAI